MNDYAEGVLDVVAWMLGKSNEKKQGSIEN